MRYDSVVASMRNHWVKKRSAKSPVDDDWRVRFHLFANCVLMCQQQGKFPLWTLLSGPVLWPHHMDLLMCLPHLREAWWKAVSCVCTWMEPVVEHTFHAQSVSLGKDSSVYRWMTFWVWVYVRNTCEPWKSVMNNSVVFPIL